MVALRCVHEMFEAQAARSPEALAVAFKSRRLSYAELNRRANQLAHYLRRRGVGPDSLVGVALHRSPQLVIALLAVWKAGGAYVPLDPTYPQKRLEFMVSDAQLGLLLTDEKSTQLFASAGGKVVHVDAEGALFKRESSANPAPRATISNLAYVMYTSGSTGRPKGAMILHSGLANYLAWAIEAYGVEVGGSVPVHSSISFDLTVTSLYPALLAGASVELLEEDSGAQNLLAALRRAGNRSLVKITPAHLDLLAQQLKPGEAAGLAKAFVIGGENLTAESLRFWREHAPATRLINEYGPTETVVGCCVYEVQPDDPHYGAVPVGRPIANTQIHVRDGEIYIGGAGVARGYLNRPEMTQERFVPDPLSSEPGARLYKTGDLGRWRADGILEYLGRIDSQVKIRGHRMELGEIEQTLAGHPAVQLCAVLAREDLPGDKQLVGYVVARKGETPNAAALQQFLRERLPEFMLPAQFVFLAAFPLTHNGKVDRKGLPVPSAEQRENLVGPRTQTETALAEIWAGLLNLERVGIDDDVFSLGAHSLLAMKALVQMRERFQVDLSLRNLFEHPTVAGLAEIIDRLQWLAQAPQSAQRDQEEITL